MTSDIDKAVLASVIIPARNAGTELKACLESLRDSTIRDYELIVVDDHSDDDTGEIARQLGARVLRTRRTCGPASARNLGSLVASSECLVFIDADVLVHRDTLERLINTLAQKTEVAAVMGSYDEAPTAKNLCSQFRNLLHHHIHQVSRPQATTFWSGCGAIRRSTFLKMGGFDPRFEAPSVEDIELGMRLHESGETLLLDRKALVTHMKRWDPLSMLGCDLFRRGVPWTRLILKSRSFPNDLNLKHSQRFSVLFSLFSVITLSLAVLESFSTLVLVLIGLLIVMSADAWLNQRNGGHFGYRFVAFLLAIVVAIGVCNSAWTLVTTCLVAVVLYANASFYRRLSRLRGPCFAVLCLPLHLLHFLVCGLAFAIGNGLHFLRSIGMRKSWFGIRVASLAVASNGVRLHAASIDDRVVISPQNLDS